MNIQHRIDRPYEAGCIEVYGDEPYEWRILDHAGHVVRDSAGYGSGASAYASAELALRDAITFDADDSVVPIFFRHGAVPMPSWRTPPRLTAPPIPCVPWPWP